MNIKEFVEKQGYAIERKDETSLRCMDDRYSIDNAPLAQYAVPGGGLGILSDVISGFENVLFPGNDSRDVKEILTDEQLGVIYRCAQKYIGTPSFHSGKSHDDIDSPVKGCGYLAATLEGKAIASEKSAYFLKSKASELVAKNYTPVLFYEDHSASYILLVEGYDIGIIPTASDGTRAYVIHKDVRTDLLAKIASGAYDELKDSLVVNGSIVSKENLIAAVFTVAMTHLASVVKNLKADALPIFIVSRNNSQIEVRPLDQNQAA
jgi:hypothetical protein